jgi:hypothetical protein
LSSEAATAVKRAQAWETICSLESIDVEMKIGVGGAGRHLGKSVVSQRLPDLDHLAEATKIRADTGVSPGDKQVAGTEEDA